MPEPFKNNFSPERVIHLASMLKQQLPEFVHQQFMAVILNDFDALELKERSTRITDALCQFMPDELPVSKSVIEAILHPEDIKEFSTTHSDELGLRGWMVMPVADFVSRRWLKEDYSREEFLDGLRFLKSLTRRFSAEFAIRDFILADQNLALKEIYSWLEDPNEHIRRLASEGTRPRLPWGKQLPGLMTDPEPLAGILEKLLDDGSEYVRRSVANNLNDIAKDNPEFVISFAEKFTEQTNTQRMRLLKHACRSLFKQGDARTLAIFGYDEFCGEVTIINMADTVKWGTELHFEVEIAPTTAKSQRLMLDYVVWHQKANGKQSHKVFKWKVIENCNKKAVYRKKHSFKPVTTRKYYAGVHKIEIQINGKIYAESEFELCEGM